VGRKEPNLKTASAQLEATLGDRLFLELRDDYVAAITALQRAESPEDVMALQLQLRNLVAEGEGLMGERRQTAKADKARRDLLARAHRPEDRVAIAELSERMAIYERLHLRDRVIVHILRCIADALVWRATGYDRALFTILGDAERVAHFADEAGAAHERRRAQELWDRGVLPIFNDLTTVLNEGDLTVLHSNWPAPHVGVEEVKASGRIKPGSRQAQRLDSKLSFLNTGRRQADNGGEHGLWRTLIPYRHRLDELAILMARARAEGIAYAFVHPALLVTAVDMAWSAEHRVDGMTYAASQVGWRADDTIAGSSVGTRLREFSSSIPGMAPWGIFPLAAEDIADLLMCRFAYAVTLCPERLVPDFRARGITLTFPTGTDRDAVFLHAHRDGDTVTVSSHLREQMLRELMTVETLVDIVDVLLQDLRHGGDVGSRTIMCDETNAWHRAPVYAGS
jgi:hypothetical protein